METKEIWKDVTGYEGLYKISNFGNLYSVRRNKNLKSSCKDYPRNILVKDGKNKSLFVHKLVAIEFIENKKNKPQVNHIDGNKLNNHYSNLEWCTRSENQIHAYKTGLQKQVLKDIHPFIKIVSIYLDGKLIVSGSKRHVCRHMKFDRKSLNQFIKGKQKTLYGIKYEIK